MDAVGAANNLAHDFRVILRDVVKLSNAQILLLTNTEGVTEATDLLGVDEASLLAIFPQTGANKLNVMCKMRLRSLREWTINRVQELSNSDEDLEPLDFTEEICGKFQIDIALRDKPGEKIGSSKQSSGTLGTFTGKAND
jgi:hypothetical protein